MIAYAPLEQFIIEKLGKTHLPGLSAAIIQDGEVAWGRGFGYRDIARGLPATPYTLYSIGSVTKSFTAMAILQLAEQGKLSLDDPVERFLPFHIRPLGEVIRIRHFLSHTSGLPALAYAEALINSAAGAQEAWLPIATPDDVLTFMDGAGNWALARPGERYFYLNEGYALLSAIIEKASGEPYKEYVREHILDPLGLRRSFFDKAQVEADPDAAVPYMIDQEKKQIPAGYAYGLSGDGGLVSNVLDLARYTLAYLRQGSLDGAQVLSPASVAEMAAPRITTADRGGPFGDAKYGYGLSILEDFYGHRLIQHSGSVGTATAYFGWVPEKQVGITLLANGSGYSMNRFGLYGLALLLGEDPEAIPFVRRDRRMSALEGAYETFRGTMKAEVRKANEYLTLVKHDSFGPTSVPLFPEDLNDPQSRFYTVVNGFRLPVEFREKDGQVELIYERYLYRKIGKI